MSTSPGESKVEVLLPPGPSWARTHEPLCPSPKGFTQKQPDDLLRPENKRPLRMTPTEETQPRRAATLGEPKGSSAIPHRKKGFKRMAVVRLTNLRVLAFALTYLKLGLITIFRSRRVRQQTDELDHSDDSLTTQ